MSALSNHDDAEAIRLSNEQLQSEVDRLKPLAEMGRMAATVAHEIRNPLAGISANAELLREAVSSGPDCESVDIILSEVERLGHLVSDLLYYSREREPDMRAIDLAWLARTTVDLSQADAERAGIILSFSGRGRAMGDADLSRQALLNVIRNAVQACRVGGRVTLTIQDGQIAITDTGCGVPEILKERLFEPFITGRTRGLGLGATVARRCQRRQQGDLRLVESSTNGSVFALTWGVP
jgi:two-component system, NtrC family, sensor histidine kinase PilS